MARRVFFSFHYQPDCWRVSQVKQMGSIEGQPLLGSNDWEEVEKGGDKKIKEWIDGEMSGKSCLVVLIGKSTAGRKWVNYEIEKAWGDGKGLVGVHIHGLLDTSSNQTTKGSNPFSGFTVGGNPLTNYAKCHDSPYVSSTYVYDQIKENLADWVEDAIKLRATF